MDIHILSRAPDDTFESMALVTYYAVELSECTVEAEPVICDHNDPMEEAHSPPRCERLMHDVPLLAI